LEKETTAIVLSFLHFG